MGEVFVFRGGKIEERRAYVIELKENDYKGQCARRVVSPALSPLVSWLLMR